MLAARTSDNIAALVVGELAKVSSARTFQKIAALVVGKLAKKEKRLRLGLVFWIRRSVGLG